MGKYVNNSKVTLGASYDKDDALKEIASLLRIGPRSDGKYYLADACQAKTINSLARRKPFDYPAYNFASMAERDAIRGGDTVNSGVNNGFGNTPMISPADYSIPHAVYTYNKPKGGSVSPNRILDFDGYYHRAGSPIHIDFPAKIYTGEANMVSIMVNYQTNNWNEDDGLRLDEIVDSNLNTAYYALLITRGNREFWLLPTQIRVNAQGSQLILVEFAPSADKLSNDIALEKNRTVFADLLNATDDTEYQIAVVATYTGYTGQAIKTTERVWSLEIKENSDRKTIPVLRQGGLNGISGHLNTTWSKTKGTAVDSFVPYSLNGTTLKVHLDTTDSWTRTFAYVECTISCNQGFFTVGSETGYEDRMFEVVKGKEVLIGGSSSGDFDIADLSSYSVWIPQSAPASTSVITVSARVWMNADKTGGEYRDISTESITI